MHDRKLLPALAAAIGLAAAGLVGPAQADINVGVTLSATGPAASLGIPEKNTFELLPTTIGGQKINWIVLDDGSDTTKAVTNTKKLISEDKVDVIVGSTITPNSLAMVDVVADAETPMISMAASARIVDPANPKTKWVFKTPQSDSLMADAIAIHMKANGVKTMGYIGFADGYGDGWLAEMRRSAQTAGIKIVGEEKYNRTDASVTGQVLKLVAANPDAILIAAAGHARARRRRRSSSRASTRARSTRRTASPIPDFLRVVGKDGDGTILPIGPDARLRAAARLATRSRSPRPSTSPSTRRSTARTRGRRSAAMPGTPACMLSAAIPEALKKARPGTKEFRLALRDALENMKEVVATPRRVHDDADRAQWPRQPGPDDDQDRKRQVGSGEVTRR